MALRQTTDDGFERAIHFRPAYDERHADPGRNYGIHGVDMVWTLRGERGAVSFLVFTNWWLPEVAPEKVKNAPHHDYVLCQPMPADLGYHSPEPTYEGQEAGDCDILPGGRCFYDGSGLNAEPVFERLLREGDEGVWAALRDYYREVFEEPAGEPG